MLLEKYCLEINREAERMCLCGYVFVCMCVCVRVFVCTLLSMVWFLSQYLTVNRSFIEDSQAGIKISPQDNNYIGLTDRVVTLTGSFEEQMRAIDLILSKLSEDSLYLQSMNAPLSYPGISITVLPD